MFDLTFTEDEKPKIIYLGDKKVEATIYLLNPWDIITDECIKHTFYNRGDWMVYTLNSKNKSRLIIKTEEISYEYILPITIDVFRSKKIICAGLNKTGTTSLAKSLKDIGLIQFPESIGHQFLTHSVVHGSYGNVINAIENIEYDFYEDIPFSFPKIYQSIFKYFPNEKYILTIRNSTEDWVNSCLNFYGEALKTEKITNFDNKIPYKHQYSSVGNFHTYNWGYPMFKMWGLKNSNNLKKDLKRIYEKHNEDFIKFMEKNNGDYIVINVSKEGELKRLLEWIGIESSKENFEHINKTEVKIY